MNIGILKETMIEYCENLYALSVNFLKNKNNIELKSMIKELELIEDKIRLCNGVEILQGHKILLNQLNDRIEEIINE